MCRIKLFDIMAPHNSMVLAQPPLELLPVPITSCHKLDDAWSAAHWDPPGKAHVSCMALSANNASSKRCGGFFCSQAGHHWHIDALVEQSRPSNDRIGSQGTGSTAVMLD